MTRQEVIDELEDWAVSYEQDKPEYDDSPERLAESALLLRNAVDLLRETK